MFDLVIRNGLIVDGTGRERFVADLAVANGEIAKIGKITASAAREIDASGLVVAPGFVDPHTHYDAQICWDSLVTPSSWHGVTSVVMGNCGVGIAPCTPKQRPISVGDLVYVEGMPEKALNAGIRWEWETFPEFMQAAGRRGSAVNLGFLAPLTPFRHYVMGEAARERAANADERAKIKHLLKEAVSAGALGFSTTLAPQHLGYGQSPLACRNADHEELKAYSQALKELGKGAIELTVTKQISVLDAEEYELIDLLLAESGRPVSWSALLERDDMPNACQDSLRVADSLIKRGARPQASIRPLMVTLEFGPEHEAGIDASAFVFGFYPSLKPTLGLPVAERMRVYADPQFRARFREDLKPRAVFNGQWDRFSILQAPSFMKPLLGCSVEEIAAARGKDGLDTFFDLIIESGFDLIYAMELFNAAEDRLEKLVRDERVLVSLSDAGAHTDFLCDAGYSTYLLQRWTRERGALSLEQAIRRLTSDPADLFGIADRGRLREGLAADIVIFDYDTVGSSKRAEIAYDMPGGHHRQIMRSQGIEFTFVNGVCVFEHGQTTGELAGRVIR